MISIHLFPVDMTISNKLMKKYSLIAPMVFLINLVLETRIFPECFKLVKVVPVYGREANDPNN